MNIFNLKLQRKKTVIKVAAILERKSGFMVIRDQWGKEHRLSEIDFPSFEWERIRPGAEIEIIVQEMIVAAKVRKTETKLPKILGNQTVPIPGYVSSCEVCGKIKTFGYEEGDNPWTVLEEIYKTHKLGSPKCDGITIGRFHIIDHNGIENEGAVRMIKDKERDSLTCLLNTIGGG